MRLLFLISVLFSFRSLHCYLFEDSETISAILTSYNKSLTGDLLPQKHRKLLFAIYKEFYTLVDSVEDAKDKNQKEYQAFERSVQLILSRRYVHSCFEKVAHQFFTTGKSSNDFGEFFSENSECPEISSFLNKIDAANCPVDYQIFKALLPKLDVGYPAVGSQADDIYLRNEDPFDHCGICVLSSEPELSQLKTDAQRQVPVGSWNVVPRTFSKALLWWVVYFTCYGILLFASIFAVKVLLTKKNK